MDKDMDREWDKVRCRDDHGSRVRKRDWNRGKKRKMTGKRQEHGTRHIQGQRQGQI